MKKSIPQIKIDFVSDADEPVQKAALASQTEKQAGRRGRKSIKELEENAELISIPEDEVLFTKQYYSIGEVAAMFRVNTSLIRYWEKEFDVVEPRKTKKGDRLFRPQDVKLLHLIYDLTRTRKFTIEGAKDYIKNDKAANEKYEMIQSLQKIRTLLLDIKARI